MNSPEQLDLPLKNIIRKSQNIDMPSQSIFFLHGFGSNMQDLYGLSPFFDGNWNCISLQASISVQFEGWAWAELDFENIRKLPKPEQMMIHEQKLVETIDTCIEKLNLDPERINLLGFSQGAALSIYSGLKNPDKFNSIVALSGFFPIKERLEDIKVDAVKRVEFFIGHGKLDPVVPLHLAQDTKKELLNLGAKCNYNEYDAEHTIHNDCLNDVLEWLRERN